MGLVWQRLIPEGGGERAVAQCASAGALVGALAEVWLVLVEIWAGKCVSV